MERRKFLKLLPALALSPFTLEIEQPVKAVEEMNNKELCDLLIQLTMLARAREQQLYNLLNLTRTRDMNLGTINWDGTVYVDTVDATKL